MKKDTYRVISFSMYDFMKILHITDKKKQLKFKIRLITGECSTKTNLSIYRINVEESEQKKFKYLKTAVICKFKKFGLTEDNFDLYWQDSDGYSIIISDNDDLALALEELDGPLYELIACLNTMITEGKLIRF